MCSSGEEEEASGTWVGTSWAGGVSGIRWKRTTMLWVCALQRSCWADAGVISKGTSALRVTGWPKYEKVIVKCE